MKLNGHERFALFGPLIVFSLLAIGCHEPNYRNEVSTNAQGGVEVHRVPKDPFPDLSESGTAQPVAAQPDQTTEKRIAALEAQVRQLSAEVAQLKKQSAMEEKKAP